MCYAWARKKLSHGVLGTIFFGTWTRQGWQQLILRCGSFTLSRYVFPRQTNLSTLVDFPVDILLTIGEHLSHSLPIPCTDPSRPIGRGGEVHRGRIHRPAPQGSERRPSFDRVARNGPRGCARREPPEKSPGATRVERAPRAFVRARRDRRREHVPLHSGASAALSDCLRRSKRSGS